MNRDTIAFKVRMWQQNGHSVGLASGGFDLLHAGHISFLTGFKQWVDKLVVGVMADSTMKMKGHGRPIIPDCQRMTIVSSLACVDGAFIFEEVGDEDNLEIIRPNVFGRGDGHTENMYELATIDGLGIKIALIHTPRITSTTEIINRIRK